MKSKDRTVNLLAASYWWTFSFRLPTQAALATWRQDKMQLGSKVLNVTVTLRALLTPIFGVLVLINLYQYCILSLAYIVYRCRVLTESVTSVDNCLTAFKSSVAGEWLKLLMDLL